ncbi:Crossover junction endonuclease MUS81 [Amphibalanus amphitrite]|uniref:Crossover junction endonuclease MUS81 n=1 Tax=Amphibalanus amphitrite TaxID=1232801 RepID=A0A6A4VR51_AMPAM|nr:Crossover junction endonuclease MUS81 [Amphibalanus amphitrite]
MRYLTLPYLAVVGFMALKSLRQYPLPLTSGKSCNILKGFGATLCARLDQRLQEHIEEHGRFGPGKRGRPAGEYRPKPGSGGFALLVALRRHEKQQGYAGFLRKAALQEAAQPLCNASLTLPEAGGYYTAWSTMGTLVKRKLVRREGNPARFSLTDVGREVADRLDSSPWTLPSQRDCFDRLTGMSPPSDCTGSSPVRVAPPVAASSSRPAEPRTVPQRLLSDTVAPSTDRLMYQYISSAGAAVRSKDDAQVSVDGGRVGFLVRCRRDELDASGRTYWTDPDRPERDGIVHVFLSDADCAEECPSGSLSGPSPPPPAAARQTKLHDMSDSDSDDEQRPTPSASVSRPVVVEDWRPAAPTVSTERRPPEPAAEPRDFTPSVVLRPGTFDVVLCVDNQETSGKSGPGACLRTYRDVVLAELQKNGVVADVRKLSVGDFLWVARPRTGKQPEELILPYIVERKRLDDLASSIRDSRYREQKFRLKRCGVPNVIYLAEAMGTGPRARSVGLPESTLQQALANCQVVDGFRVKWTADQRETAAFLTSNDTPPATAIPGGCKTVAPDHGAGMGQERFRCPLDGWVVHFHPDSLNYRQLEGCPREQLPAGPPSAGGPERLQLFSEFHQLSAKRQRLTARDMFAKMLLQLSGLSADKAAAIVAVYPTVTRLLEAYAGCGSQAEAEKLLAPLRADRSGRPVGAAISKAVYHLYSDRQLT